MPSHFGSLLSEETRARVIIPSVRRVVRTEDLPGTSADLVDPCETEGYSRIVGLCRSDVAGTVTIYQGSGLDDADMEYATVVNVPANAAEGAGAAWEVSVAGEVLRVAWESVGDPSDFRFLLALRSV